MTTLFEYVDSHHHPLDPDARTVAVTAELLEESVAYYLENLSARERSDMLSDYLYEESYDKSTTDADRQFVISMVQDYIRDHE